MDKKYWLASATAAGILWGGGYLWYRVMLKDFYKNNAPRSVRRRHPIPGVNLASRAIAAMWLAQGYQKQLQNGTNPGNGFRYGLWAGSLGSIPAGLTNYANIRMGLPAALATFGAETVLGGLAGMAVAKIYGQPYGTDTDMEDQMMEEDYTETGQGRVYAPPEAEVAA